MYLSVLVGGEIRQGIERLRRRNPIQAERLEKHIEMRTTKQGRVLVVTENIAQQRDKINSPDPLPAIDGLLVATALQHGMMIVTRNVRDMMRSVLLLNSIYYELLE